jgi:hypothetical protein
MKLMLRTFLYLTLILVLLAACTPSAPASEVRQVPTVTVSATASQQKTPLKVVPAYPAAGNLPADGGGALASFIEGAGLIMSKTDPGEALLVVGGDLPTPCDSLTFKVAQPDLKNQIMVSLAILPPAHGTNCEQAIQAVHKEIPLGKLTSGAYTVLINGQQAGSITVP